MSNKFEPRELQFDEIRTFSPFLFRGELHVASTVEPGRITINKIMLSDKLGQNRIIYRKDYIMEEFETTDKIMYVRVSEFIGDRSNAKGATFLKNIGAEAKENA